MKKYLMCLGWFIVNIRVVSTCGACHVNITNWSKNQNFYFYNQRLRWFPPFKAHANMNDRHTKRKKTCGTKIPFMVFKTSDLCFLSHLVHSQRFCICLQIAKDLYLLSLEMTWDVVWPCNASQLFSHCRSKNSSRCCATL